MLLLTHLLVLDHHMTVFKLIKKNCLIIDFFSSGAFKCKNCVQECISSVDILTHSSPVDGITATSVTHGAYEAGCGNSQGYC